MKYIENADFNYRKEMTTNIDDESNIQVMQDIDGGKYCFSVSFYENSYFLTPKDAINLRIKLDSAISDYEFCKKEAQNGLL